MTTSRENGVLTTTASPSCASTTSCMTAMAAESSCTPIPSRSTTEFFFEIVQRGDGYNKYGAANASVHMAAQAKRRSRPTPRLLG
jgi:hypothetical protein